MTVVDFSFGAHAEGFDEHIRRSIPGLGVLRQMSVDLSRHFVQPGTRVVDIGCSTGSVLSSIRQANALCRVNVQYLGIDIEPRFASHWRAQEKRDLEFKVADVCTFEGMKNVSLAVCMFTSQFIPETDRASLLRRVHDGLVEGGAFIIAEKVLAQTARFQDLFVGPYYDFKRRKFSEKEILDKERSLRGPMHCWYESELVNALCQSGFERAEIHRFWQSYFFVGILAVKRGLHRPKTNSAIGAA